MIERRKIFSVLVTMPCLHIQPKIVKLLRQTMYYFSITFMHLAKI